MEQLHIQNPLLFALLHIIDAAPFNVHPFAPRLMANFSRTPSLLPDEKHALYPAFSYVVVESRKFDPNRTVPPNDRRVLLTIEAALWEQMPKADLMKDCDWYYTMLRKYTNPIDNSINTGLLIKDLAVIGNKLIEIEAKLKAIIYALDAKPTITTDSAFEIAFGFKRDGDIICKTFTDTSSAQLIGVVARFQLFVNDNFADLCNKCGWGIDMSQLTSQALADKISVTSLKNCV